MGAWEVTVNKSKSQGRPLYFPKHRRWVQFSKLILRPKSRVLFFLKKKNLYCQTELQTNYKIRESWEGEGGEGCNSTNLHTSSLLKPKRQYNEHGIILSRNKNRNKWNLASINFNNGRNFTTKLISSIMDQTSHGGTSSELLKLMVTYGYTNFNIISGPKQNLVTVVRSGALIMSRKVLNWDILNRK